MLLEPVLVGLDSERSYQPEAALAIGRLRRSLRFRSAAELGNERSSLNSAISSSSRMPGASSARSLPSFASTVSSRVNPAARSSWAMKG